jgi:hypothetical protein
MDVKTFWDLIKEADGDDKRLQSLLQDEKPEEIRGFGDIFDVHVNKAFNWNLWAAAYLINGGCNEEEFDEFIYWLIGKGKDIYEAAIEDPDSLVDHVKDNESTFDDRIIISIARALDRKGKAIEGRAVVTIPADLMEFKAKPKSPRGKEWDDDENLLEMFPKLGERFGEMIEWEEEEEEEEEEEDWDDEDKDKSKLRRFWDKVVEFFAKVFDGFLNLFRKREKDEEEEEEEKEEPSNRLVTKREINMWLYLAFFVMFIGFIALIPLTIMFRNNVMEQILTLEFYQSFIADFQISSLSSSWEYFTDIIIARTIISLTTRFEKWGQLQFLWIFSLFVTFFAGLQFFKIIFQHKFIEFSKEKWMFLNRKEELKREISIKEIESIWKTTTNSIQLNPKKTSDLLPIMLIDLEDLKPLNEFLKKNKIPTEETSFMKMLVSQIKAIFRKLVNKN